MLLRVDRTSLPNDAVHKGYEQCIVTDISFQRERVCYRREKYYSPSLNQSFVAQLPTGYADGQYGPAVHTLVLSLYAQSGMSEPKIKQLLAELGVPLSAGLISNWLSHQTEIFVGESQAVLEAGLESSAWQQLDDTSTRVNATNQACLIICNSLYTYYQTNPTKERLAVLRVLAGGKLRYRYNEEARALLCAWKVPAKWIGQLAGGWPTEQDDLSEVEFKEWLGDTCLKCPPSLTAKLARLWGWPTTTPKACGRSSNCW